MNETIIGVGDKKYVIRISMKLDLPEELLKQCVNYYRQFYYIEEVIRDHSSGMIHFCDEIKEAKFEEGPK